MALISRSAADEEELASNIAGPGMKIIGCRPSRGQSLYYIQEQPQMKQIRYSFNSFLAPTTPDTAEVLYGATLPPTARLLPPCAPSKIVCVGRNYLEHARE